jgi:hypothetical protein
MKGLNMGASSFDMSGLNKALRMRIAFQGRTDAEVVNTAAYYISARAKQLTPFETVAQIDSDLGKVSSPRVDRQGNLVTRKGKQVMRHSFTHGSSRAKDVPLVALIIATRAAKGSVSTEGVGRWSNFKNPFKGVSRAAGAAAMKRLALKLLRGRRSSTHFVQSGWIDAMKRLSPFAVKRRGSSMDDAKYDYDFTDRAGVTSPAKAGTGLVSSTAENATGQQGVNAVSVQKAIQTKGAIDAMEQAIKEEEINTLAYMQKRNDELFNEMNAMLK